MAVKSSFRNMVLCLLVICLVCSALLAGVYALTKAPIDAAAAAKTNNAIAQVVPPFDGEPVMETVQVAGNDYVYYVVTKDGKVAGYAIQASSSGFGGTLSLMVGMTASGEIFNTSVLSHSETPGLGAKCTEPAFADQFKGFNPSQKKLAVKKDGGDVDAITASTITSRAYCVALENAVAAYNAIAGVHGQDCCGGCQDGGCCGSCGDGECCGADDACCQEIAAENVTE
ncbi:MAG: RnfABCDGE type electron transport complex subunit G [Clostridium sp.]|nr:RnfABCDGE type electron transport complex subunit G [Bacteroides sp.]MCM1198316.1 RnfABCDGE type electron transport complex subunit G [Clostridium sp.]